MSIDRRLILVRHGQSTGNAENLFTGMLDLPLTDRGRAEAASAAQALQAADEKVGTIFTSALQRTRDTGAIIAQVLGMVGGPLVAHPALNERDYGQLSGLNKDEARQIWGEAQVRLWRRSYLSPPPDGESLRDTVARVVPFFLHTMLPSVMRGGGVLVVAHGNSLRALLMALDGLSATEVEGLEIATGEVIRYQFDADASARRLPPLTSS